MSNSCVAKTGTDGWRISRVSFGSYMLIQINFNELIYILAVWFHGNTLV